MRAAIALLLIPLLATSVLSAELAVSGPNQGMIVYCSGTGCSPAYGTSILDLSNAGNWTLLMRFRLDPAIVGGNHDLFSQSTLVGGAFTCAGIYLRVPGANVPLSVNLTIIGGVSSFAVLGGSTNIVPGTWYSIAVTHDSSHNWTIYKNGVSDATTNSSVTISSGCNVFIATVSGATDCGSSGVGGDLGCWINDVAMFPSVLSLGDIKAFASGTRPNLLSARPSVWYPMEGSKPLGCAGSIGPNPPDMDASGNLHTLRLGNNPAEDYCQPNAQTNGIVAPPTGEATH